MEGKNGAVMRKLIGYGHIASHHAEAVQKFHTAYLNPYRNFHRPSGFATISLDVRGKRRRTYKAEDYAAPYEKLRSLTDASKYLKPEVSFTSLDRLAQTMSDTESARKMSRAKAVLLRLCKLESPIPPKFSGDPAEKSAVEMTESWKARKTKPGFPALPTTPWESHGPSEIPHSHSRGHCSFIPESKPKIK